jgi:septum formation inhibitor MinC
MDNKNYISEDFETLMIQKSFEELLPEEKTFVLQHVKDQAEYDQLRNLLFQVIELGQDDDDLAPDPKVKAHLDQLFETGTKKSVVPWYNTPLFWSSISGIAAVFVLAFWWLNVQTPEKGLMAENRPIETEEKSDEPTLSASKDNSSSDSNGAMVKQENSTNEVAQDNIVTMEEVSASANSDYDAVEPPDPSDKYPALTPSDESVEEKSMNAPPRIPDAVGKPLGTALYTKGQDQLIKDIQSAVLSDKQKTKSVSESDMTDAVLSKEKASKKEADVKTVDSELVSGKYFLRLKVDANGKLEDVIILRSPNPGSKWDYQMVKAIRSQLGSFQPCVINGNKVPSDMVVPVQLTFD